MSEAEQ